MQTSLSWLRILLRQVLLLAEIDMLAEARKVVDAVLASLSVQFDLKG